MPGGNIGHRLGGAMANVSARHKLVALFAFVAAGHWFAVECTLNAACLRTSLHPYCDRRVSFSCCLWRNDLSYFLSLRFLLFLFKTNISHSLCALSLASLTTVLSLI